MNWNNELLNKSSFALSQGSGVLTFKHGTSKKFRHQAENKYKADTKYIYKLNRALSPLVIMVVFLLFLLPFMKITGTGSIESTWQMVLLFSFCATNLLFADFALWNWFEGKQLPKIWLIELVIAFSVLYLIIL